MAKLGLTVRVVSTWEVPSRFWLAPSSAHSEDCWGCWIWVRMPTLDDDMPNCCCSDSGCCPAREYAEEVYSVPPGTLGATPEWCDSGPPPREPAVLRLAACESAFTAAVTSAASADADGS